MGAEIHGGHENNEEYFNRVYNETCRSVSRFVVSKCGNMEDAEDIIQNVYTRFFKRISEKGHEDIESPEAFLINIAKFECRTYFSDRKKDDKVSSFSDYTEEEMVAIEREMSKPQQRLEDVISNKIVAKQIFDDNAVLVHLEKGIRKILDGKQINSFRRKADEEIHLVFCVAGTKYFYLFHKAISFLV